jgi:hypothetical protein
MRHITPEEIDALYAIVRDCGAGEVLGALHIILLRRSNTDDRAGEVYRNCAKIVQRKLMDQLKKVENLS